MGTECSEIDSQRLAEGRRRSRSQKFLHTHKLYRPQTCAERLELFAKAGEWQVNEGMVNAKSLYAVAKARQLRTLQTQLDEYRRRIEAVFASHPDSGMFGSLPGAGPKIGPRLLSEIGSDRTLYEDGPQGLQCMAGTAPVSYQSGKIAKVQIRRACNKSLRHAMHLFAHKSTEQCTWAKVSITRPCSRRAKVMRRRCARWASAGSRSSGRCGRREPATMRNGTSKTSSPTVHGS